MCKDDDFVVAITDCTNDEAFGDITAAAAAAVEEEEEEEEVLATTVAAAVIADVACDEEAALIVTSGSKGCDGAESFFDRGGLT